MENDMNFISVINKIKKVFESCITEEQVNFAFVWSNRLNNSSNDNSDRIDTRRYIHSIERETLKRLNET